jgi:hypothetical protein
LWVDSEVLSPLLEVHMVKGEFIGESTIFSTDDNCDAKRGRKINCGWKEAHIQGRGEATCDKPIRING